jgi:hypothetical protein
VIKLKTLLERIGDRPPDDMNLSGIMATWYNFFNRANPVMRIKLATWMITSKHNDQLTPDNVYQIILGVPRPAILKVYELATKHLTHDQLSQVIPWIEMLAKEKQNQDLDKEKRLGDLLANVLSFHA